MAPQAVYAASATLCVTHRTGVQPRPQLKPTLTDLACSHIAARSPIVCRSNHLMVFTPVIQTNVKVKVGTDTAKSTDVKVAGFRQSRDLIGE